MAGPPDVEPRGPLVGYRVLDLSTTIAGPFATALLADFGADVIKVELPGQGDPARGFPPLAGGKSLYEASLGRNKRAITLDVRKPRGRELLLALVAQSDVVVENFRPGTLERWNLGYEVLKEANRDVILVRISGYGQDGPYRDKAGYGTPAAAIAGLTYITGFPGQPPATVPIALADYLAGLFAAFSATMGLLERQRRGEGGQAVDVSLYESVFRLLEVMVAEYGHGGRVRERIGNRNGISAPIGTFRTADGLWMVLSVSNERVWQRMIEAMGHPEWNADPRFRTNADRVAHNDETDDVVAGWFAQRTMDEAQRVLDEAGVPVCPVLSMADIFADPHYAARADIATPMDPDVGPVPMPAVVPRLSRTPGAVRFPAARLGEHNDEVFGGLLALSTAEQEKLRAEGVI